MSSLQQQTLTDDEIDVFVSSLDLNNDGRISKAEVERKLEDVYKQLRPHTSTAANIKARRSGTADSDVEKTASSAERKLELRRHAFVMKLLGASTNTNNQPESSIAVQDFKDLVRSWNVPSLEQEKREEYQEEHYLDNVSLRRKARAWWSVVGPECVFMAVVVGSQLGLGIWQCLKYALGQEYQAAFGWGVALAKFAAGSLYATLFFLLLSMSRWWSTALRRSYYVSRFINWDHSQAFHILMSIEALCFATLHAIGHLAGTFNFGSNADRQSAVGALLGYDVVPRSYVDYVRTLPGASGLTALGILYLISLMSMPVIRRWSYEVFQAAHLLMFPFIGLLMCHGARKLLQYPVMGFVLALPTALIVIERGTRLIRSFRHIPASVEVLDDNTVCVTCNIPASRIWPYEAGQYVFLQVPELSWFQWHPFTISTCLGREMQLHIKTDGDWTSRLRELAEKDLEGEAKRKATKISIGIDGPFGAPAQRFYDFDQTVIVGAGIGITPFSAILHDLQEREDHRWSVNAKRRSRSLRSLSRTSSAASAQQSSTAIEQARARLAERRREVNDREPQAAQSDSSPTVSTAVDGETSATTMTTPNRRGELGRHASILPDNQHVNLDMYRRVDMHWIVRDKNHLLWFSDLLNDICTGTQHDREHLDIRLSNHVTRKHKDVALHVFRWLLERHRQDDDNHNDKRTPSLLTGLIAQTHFGRPNFPVIMHTHYDEMKQLFERDSKRRRRIGVFFCGAPVIGAQLADLCAELTVRGRQDGTKIQYHFQMEVFN